MFREGSEVRWIQNDRDSTGTAIAEEGDIDPATLSALDVETIWSKFGLRPYYAGLPPFRALFANAFWR